MNFFFHSTWGMVYFVILSAICAFAIYRGDRETRLLASCVLGVFLADRTLLATITDEGTMIFLGGVAEFIACLLVIVFGTAVAATRVVAFLFAAKMLMYVCLLSGLIGFGTMAAWTELAGYLQLLIIAAGAADANRGKRTRNHGDISHGIGSVLHMGKSGGQDK